MILSKLLISEAGDDKDPIKKTVPDADDKSKSETSVDDIDFNMDSKNSDDDSDKKNDNFDELVSNMNTIKFSRELNFDINHIDLNVYNSEFVGQTKNKSLLFGVMDDDSLINDILGIIKHNIPNFGNDKVILIFSDVLNPKDILNSKNSVQFVIANYLKSIIRSLTFDVWFDISQSIIDDVIKRTNRSSDEVTAAIYCVLKLRQSEDSLLEKFGTQSVFKLLDYYGVDRHNIQSIESFVFPEESESSQNVISYIVKMFNHVLMVELLNKVIRYEKNDCECIVLCNMNVAYKLRDTFKKLYVKAPPPKIDKDHENQSNDESDEDENAK